MIRNGNISRLEGMEVVVGDLIVVTKGDKLEVDVGIIEYENLNDK